MNVQNLANFTIGDMVCETSNHYYLVERFLSIHAQEHTLLSKENKIKKVKKVSEWAM